MRLEEGILYYYVVGHIIKSVSIRTAAVMDDPNPALLSKYLPGLSHWQAFERACLPRDATVSRYHRSRT
jgi:hypothetical protein